MGPGKRQRGRPRVSLPLDQWPAADRAAWECAMAPGLPLDDGGQASRWRPATQATTLQCYGHYLAFLSGRNELAGQSDPVARLRPDLVQALVTELRQGRASATVANTIGILVMAARVMWPDHAWDWLRRMRATLHARAEPRPSKLGRTVSPPAVLDLGETLMREAEALLASKQLNAAMRYRDGLLLALLALDPERRKNLVSIEIGQQLQQHPDGWQLRFAAEETKHHRLRELAFPPVLVPALERYLQQFRPILLTRAKTPGTATPRLWVTWHGEAMSPLRLWQVVRRHTGERHGIAMGPHLARTAAASFLGEEHPELVRMAAPVLGHESFRTTEGTYILAKGHSAFRQHHDRITARRAALRRTPKRQPRNT